MAKRKKLEVPRSVVRFIIAAGLVFVLGIGLFRAVNNLLTQSSFFQIKAVKIDASLYFIDQKDLRRLTGKNILTIDLKKVERQLGSKYPQVSQIKIVRRFPDQILVVAKKRVPLAQAIIKNKVLTLDEKGFVLATAAHIDKNLTMIDGVTYTQNISPGLPIINKELQTALKIIKSFKSHESFKKFNILKINVQSLSKIEFYLTEDFSIIIDWERFDNKMDVLALLLSRGQLNFKEVKYIDLRFTEPIIGRKNVPENKI